MKKLLASAVLAAAIGGIGVFPGSGAAHAASVTYTCTGSYGDYSGTAVITQGQYNKLVARFGADLVNQYCTPNP